METYIVVSDLKDWPVPIVDAQVIHAREFINEFERFQKSRIRVFNFCRSYKYQSVGYYVSLLAEARGHKVVPNTSTIQDLKYQALSKIITSDLQEQIQSSLKDIHSDEFTLSVYFGYNLAERHNKLARKLFSLFHTPILRTHFFREKNRWIFDGIEAVSLNNIPENHRDFFFIQAKKYFDKHSIHTPRKKVYKYDLAILYNKDDSEPPSDMSAIKNFIRAAQQQNVYTEIVTKENFSEISRFDAVFIRDTTMVNHYTYRFSRRAQAEGLIVIDDPDSILKCTNKVYLTELLRKNKVLIPHTIILGKYSDLGKRMKEIEYPCILKQPDSCFSQGVIKVHDEVEFLELFAELMKKSDLVIVQKFMPTEFDWRIGVLDNEPLFACKYYMAKDHWQIINAAGSNEGRYGRTETLPIQEVPFDVVNTAVKAAKLVGDGLYGVDIKFVNDKSYVIEINDNPSIDSGIEDAVLKNELYDRIVSSFIRRIEKLKA